MQDIQVEPLFDDDDELIQDLHPKDYRSLIVYSRDWTIGTILQQIKDENIKLDPEFQRRNAWTDDKRSGLIESLIVGIPVPQIVFAENPEKRKSYIVIDGRQRLLTIAGFFDPSIGFWKEPKLKLLQLREDLDGQTASTLERDKPDAYRELNNADMRCGIIASREATNDLLYYVFYRLNTGSVSLSTQELRQALSRGAFSSYLSETTSKSGAIHKLMGLDGPDNRYRDAEVLLRYISFSLFLPKYRGNLKLFLDNAMDEINADWSVYEAKVKKEYKKLLVAINLLESVFGQENIGRRPLEDGRYDRRFNRAVFEVQVYFFKKLTLTDLKGKEGKLKSAFEKMFSENDRFRQSVSSTTKSLDQYDVRFATMRNLLLKTLKIDLESPSFA